MPLRWSKLQNGRQNTVFFIKMQLKPLGKHLKLGHFVKKALIFYNLMENKIIALLFEENFHMDAKV